MFKKLKEKAALLKREIKALYFAYGDPQTPWLPKVILLITLGYALSPIDLIPDFIPLLGYLDDLILLPALISLSIKLIPPGVMARAREQAVETPVNLRDNWVFGVLFIVIWIGVIGVVVFSLLK